jgi:hypothetical protein
LSITNPIRPDEGSNWACAIESQRLALVRSSRNMAYRGGQNTRVFYSFIKAYKVDNQADRAIQNDPEVS